MVRRRAPGGVAVVRAERSETAAVRVERRVATRDEPGERTRQIVRRSLPYESAAAGAGLDDAEKLERPQRFTNRRARDLELLGELSLGWELIAGAKVALLEQTLDLLDDPLI